VVVCLKRDASDWLYGPADDTVIPSFLALLKPDWLKPLRYRLTSTQVVLEKRPLNGCL